MIWWEKILVMSNSIELKNFSEIYENYDVFIVDLWGVVHNGEKIFNGIFEVLDKIKLLNKKVFFMTNAPRRSQVIENQLSVFGLKRSLYECVISSGEITWQSLKKKKYKFCYIIGPERDHHLIKGLDYQVSKDYKNVEIIINTGPWGFDDKLENYKPILEGLAQSKPLMICSNPDKIVVRGDRFVICAGLLAQYYESIGGKVTYFGKPYNEIYNYCYEKIPQKNRRKILVIGDSLDNDITGAKNQNLDSLLVTDGIHRDVNSEKSIDKAKLNDLIKKKKITPTYYIRDLIF